MALLSPSKPAILYWITPFFSGENDAKKKIATTIWASVAIITFLKAKMNCCPTCVDNGRVCKMHSMGPAINYNYEVHPYTHTHVKYGVNVKSHDIVNAITAGLSYSFFQAIILCIFTQN